MRFIDNILKRIFYFSVDAYFVYVTFSESLDETKAELPFGYSVRAVDISNNHEMQALVSLWLSAYYSSRIQDIDRATEDIDQLAQNKNTCFGLFFGIDLVGMHWMGCEDAINTLEFARILKDYPNTAILHHVFILSNHRGKTLQNPMMMAGSQAAKNIGRTRFYTFVGVRNFASVRNMMKCSDKYQLIYHLKIEIPFFTFHFFPGSDISKLREIEK